MERDVRQSQSGEDRDHVPSTSARSRVGRVLSRSPDERRDILDRRIASSSGLTCDELSQVIARPPRNLGGIIRGRRDGTASHGRLAQLVRALA
jgi:hypothetical protein